MAWLHWKLGAHIARVRCMHMLGLVINTRMRNSLQHDDMNAVALTVRCITRTPWAHAVGACRGRTPWSQAVVARQRARMLAAGLDLTSHTRTCAVREIQSNAGQCTSSKHRNIEQELQLEISRCGAPRARRARAAEKTCVAGVL